VLERLEWFLCVDGETEQSNRKRQMCIWKTLAGVGNAGSRRLVTSLCEMQKHLHSHSSIGRNLHGTALNEHVKYPSDGVVGRHRRHYAIYTHYTTQPVE
jgi:hypothetical protein